MCGGSQTPQLPHTHLKVLRVAQTGRIQTRTRPHPLRLRLVRRRRLRSRPPPSSSASSIVREVVPVEVPAQKNKINKYLDFRPKRTGTINTNNMSPILLGSLPNITTNDHVTNSIIKFRAKIWLPKKVISNKYTPKKNLPFIERMVSANILEETKTKPKNLIMLFPVPKTDPSNPRMIMDFKPFTKETNSPQFKLPNIRKLTKLASSTDHMVKLNLTNGFFHISLHQKTRGLFGIKCKNKYYVIKKLPQGLSVSPYIMQRVMSSILKTMLANINVKYLVYLDDILLLGSPKELEKAKIVLLASSFLFNEEKCDLKPTRILTYLGVVIDLENQRLN